MDRSILVIRVIRLIRGCFRVFVTLIRVIGVIRGSFPFYARSSKNIIWTIQTSEFLARQANPDLLNLRANWPADQAYR